MKALLRYDTALELKLHIQPCIYIISTRTNNFYRRIVDAIATTDDSPFNWIPQAFDGTGLKSTTKILPSYWSQSPT